MTRPARDGTRAGEYEITGVLGQGGMGTVYSGVHPVIGTKVAIKVLDPRIADAANVERFVREARVVNKIRHPNIIEIFAFGDSPDLGHYFVMPLLEGLTLADRISVGGPLTAAAAHAILLDVAVALDAAHDAGVYHRDLKPENIFLSADGRGQETARVLDFGIAKLTDATSVSVTNEKFSMGTPLYMSPEQWAAVANVDHRTDIYALGVVLHFMLTGRHPFEGRSPVTLMRLHTSEPPAPASQHGAPPSADPVIAKALAKAKEDRYQRASELAEAFAAASEDSAVDPLAATGSASGNRRVVAALAPTEHATGSSRRPRRGRLALIGGAIAAALVAGGLYLSRGRGEDGGDKQEEPTTAPVAPVPSSAGAPVLPTPAPDAAPAPEVSPEGRAGGDVTRPREQRPRDSKRPRRKRVQSTWGKTDNPF